MRKGSVWIVDFSSGRGHEQAGERPALFLGLANGLITAIPLTSNLERAKLSHTCVLEPTKENGLSEPSVALVFQIIALDKSRFRKMIGWITEEQKNSVDALIRDLMKL